jgi:peptidoglycan/xylan/chitin deacetylase (PgdA/CDA1 family)
MSRIWNSLLYSLALLGAAVLAYVGFDSWLSVTGRKSGPSVAEKVVQQSQGTGPIVRATPLPANPEIISLVQSLRAADQDTSASGSGAAATARINPRANLVASAVDVTKPIRSWPTGKNRIALTYDDGPHPTVTPRLLELLKSKNVRATFFVIGPNLQRHPDIGQSLIESGMEVANHSMTHPTLSRKPEAAIRSELEGTNNIITSVLGRTVTLMRPPYGAVNPRVELVSSELGLKIVNWSVDTDDWRPNMTVERMKQRISDGISDGAIILMHDRSDKVLTVTEWAIEEIRKRGFELVTVSELLNLKGQQPIERPDVAEPVQAEPPSLATQTSPTTPPVSAQAAVTPPAGSMDQPLQAPTNPPTVAVSAPSRPATRNPSIVIEDAANPAQIPTRITPRPTAIPMELPTGRAVMATPQPLSATPAVEIPADAITPLPPSQR